MIESSRIGPLRIKFISSHDPTNVRAFSGTIFHMGAALRRAMPQVELIHSARPAWSDWLEDRILKISRGRLNPAYWRPLNRYFAKRLARSWRGQRVVAIAVVFSPVVAELAASVPVVHISDATFDLMRNFYANVARLSERDAAEAERAERSCIERSVHCSFSSKWAANSAMMHYGASKEKVSSISWGCNIEAVPRPHVREADTSRTVCRLLFLGADWVRKGGDIAAATAELLHLRGMPVQLDLVGAPPPHDLEPRPWLNSHGFLSKSDPEQVARLNALIRNSDFLFLPTRQDCTPMVFAEANAYGTPAVTRDVGGVADVVHHKVNGVVLPSEAGPSEFADAIEEIWNNHVEFAELRRSARAEYENRLNWSVWASEIADLLERLEDSGSV